MSDAPIKVMHLRCTSGDISGPDKTILNSPLYVDPARIDMHLFYLKKKIDQNFRIPRRAKNMGIDQFYWVEEKSQLDREARQVVGEHLDRLGIDILHTHDYKTDWWGWLLRKGRPHLKLVTTVHGWGVMNTFRERVYYQLGKIPLYFFDRIIAVNQEIIDSLRTIGIPAHKMVLIPNAIDCEVFSRQRPLKTGQGPLEVGYIGRLSREKRVEDLIQAFAQLRDHPQLGSLWIAGEGPRLAFLRELVDQEGLRDRVRFLGHVEAGWFFNQIDIFVNPSLKEGLPNTVLEAMAMEAAVIATPVGGVPTVIRHRETGLHIPPASVPALRDALRFYLDNPRERVRLVKAARALVQQNHNFALRMVRMQQLYLELFPERKLQEPSHVLPAY